MPDHRRPKLGQHFLADPGARRRIVEALELRAQELVIEIGAGRGEMTRLLAERARRVVAIELDPTLVRMLNEQAGSNRRIEVMEADILATDIPGLCRRAGVGSCFVFGNLPYYITSPILNHLRASWASIRAMGLLVQHEVAIRMTASPGRRAYGYLSLLAQAYWRPRIAITLPARVFSPRPKVKSALVLFGELKPAAGETPPFTLQPGERERFLKFAQGCFAQKRKNILNNLATIYGRERAQEGILALGLPATIRAEQLTVEQLAALFRRLGI